MEEKVRAAITLMLLWGISALILGLMYYISKWSPLNGCAWFCFTWVAVPVVVAIAVLTKLKFTGWNIKEDGLFKDSTDDPMFLLLLLPAWPILLILFVTILFFEWLGA